MEGSDGWQGRLGVGSQEASEGGEAQSGFDEVEGGAAVFEVAGEESIAGADVAEGVGQGAVAVEDALDVGGHPWGSRKEGPWMRNVWHRCRSRLSRASTMGALPRKWCHSS